MPRFVASRRVSQRGKPDPSSPIQATARRPNRAILPAAIIRSWASPIIGCQARRRPTHQSVSETSHGLICNRRPPSLDTPNAAPERRRHDYSGARRSQGIAPRRSDAVRYPSSVVRSPGRCLHDGWSSRTAEAERKLRRTDSGMRVRLHVHNQ